MKFSEIIYQKAEAELKNRRQQAERLADMRRKEFLGKYPELMNIENEMKNAALDVIRSVGANGKPVDIETVDMLVNGLDVTLSLAKKHNKTVNKTVTESLTKTEI